MLETRVQIEMYRKDKVPTLKGSEPRGGTDREQMTQQSLVSTGERDGLALWESSQRRQP